jgi:hypothetical protein
MSTTFALSQELLWIAMTIHTHGIAVIAVGSGACHVPGCRCGPEARSWSYTVGFAERGHPEVVTFGLHPGDAVKVSNLVRNEELAGAVVRPRDEMPLLGQTVRFAEVPEEWAAGAENPMGAWFRHYEPGRPALDPPIVVQLLWQDDDGRFPGDPGCDPIVAAAQPTGEMLASPDWLLIETRLRKRMIASSQRHRFT